MSGVPTAPDSSAEVTTHDALPVVVCSSLGNIGSIGTTSGAVGGGLWTLAASRGPVGAINIVVGVVAFAVLGGMAAFAMFAFAQVLSGAMWQAITASSAVGEADESTK